MESSIILKCDACHILFSFNIAFCKTLPNLAGIEYIGMIDDGNLLIGTEIPFQCKKGFDILDSTESYAGPRGLTVCEENFWTFDKHCFGIFGVCDIRVQSHLICMNT